VNSLRMKIAALASVAGLGALGGYALSSNTGASTQTQAALTQRPKPKVKTQVTHRTVHVNPKHQNAAAASGPPGGVASTPPPAPVAAPSPAPAPTSSPVVSGSSGSSSSAATSQPVATHTSGSSGGSGGGGSVATHTSGAGGSGGESEHEGGGEGGD
jgi:hypothetical protein